MMYVLVFILFLHTHTHTHTFNLPFPGLPRWAGSRKVKPIWILLKQERVSGSGISWAMYKSAPHSRQITTPEPHHSVFYWLYALPAAQPTASKLWRHMMWDLLFLHIIPETISTDHCWLFLWFLVSDSCHKCSNVPVLISCYQWHQEPECVPGQNYSRGPYCHRHAAQYGLRQNTRHQSWLMRDTDVHKVD